MATMVAGLKFLSKKGFNPQNLSNQKRVWEVEQTHQDEARRARERQQQLEREREEEELARSRGDPLRLQFVYQPPPGLVTASQAEQQEPDKFDEEIRAKKVHHDEMPDRKQSAAVTTTSLAPFAERQPGDDDAAAEFRRMLAAAAAGNDDGEDVDANKDEEGKERLLRGQCTGFGTVLQGSTYDTLAASRDQEHATSGQHKKGGDNARLSALEKAVGRKKEGGAALTLEEQIQRFPALANAPRAPGMNSSDINVTFKPLGTQIRNVRCMACQRWGHSRGDRECPMTGWDPFSSSSRSGPPPPTASARHIPPDTDPIYKKDDRPKRSRDDTERERDDSSSSTGSSSYERHRERKREKKRRKSERSSRKHRKSKHKSSRRD